MTPFWRTLLVEVQRGFARRMVRIMALFILAGFLLAAFLNFRADSDAPAPGESFAVVVEDDDPSPFALDLVELWPDDDVEPVLALGAVPLMMAALVIGASLVGAEWRAGTMTTNLTWEPRRVRLAVAKFLGAGIVAFLFSAVLQAVFVGLLLPNIAAHGSREGTDGEWFVGFAGGLTRGALLAAVIAIAAAALAMVGRNTTVAIATGFVMFSIVENILRAWKPWTDRWLLTSNASRVYIGNDGILQDGTMLTAGRAGVVTAIYLGTVVVAAIALFARRDVASTS